MNKVILMGRLTKEPDVKEYGKGKEKKKVASITIAVPKIKKDEAEFVNCILFDKKAEVAEKYLNKGTRILLEGYLQTDSYKDKDGNTKYITRVITTNLEFADNKISSDKEEESEAIADDLPF